MNSIDRASLIGGDWGSTSLRIYLIDDQGDVLDQRSSELGLLKAREYGFDKALAETAGDWLDLDLPVLLTGMVGARGGWLEVGYQQIPAGFAKLAEGIKKVPCARDCVYIVPGLSQVKEECVEVMRGEETQVCGAIASGLGDGHYALVGTHSKWASVQDGEIINFATYISGDVFAALSNHSVLAALLPVREKWDWTSDAFAKGVSEGASTTSGGQLLNKLFQARTLGLASKLEPEQLGPYLSGMLIGAELKAANVAQATVIGAKYLVDLYCEAAGVIGIKLERAPDDLVVKGLAELAKNLAE